MRDDNAGADKDGKKRRTRCAIYTRKSTTAGLEMDFNSLDAQREACEKYIESQKGEGWVLWPECYDDGGYSGGNVERPALQRLLEDVRARKFDCIVVYKIDRLSRSLMDFAGIVQLLDQHEVTFVSTTQSFNTGSSMGRLTLHVLLSFAQFEREVGSERVRDKMSAARRHGKWVGGSPPLGYDIDREKKRLIVNPEEAEQVRLAFDLYLKHRSILATVRDLNARRLTTKHRFSKKGRETGGGSFHVSNLQQILRNPYYIGKVAVDGELYPGEHEAILSEEVFRAVERLRKENCLYRSGTNKKGPTAFLKGLLRCRSCSCAMIHSYTQRNGRRYTYYVCTRALQMGRDTCPAPSVNAQSMDDAVMACFKKVTEDLKTPMDPHLRGFFSHTWDQLFPAEKARIFRTALEGLEYDGKTGALSLRLSDRGMQSLAREFAPAEVKVA